MLYTRKRALLACDFCRHRKRRCDGERPCSTCRESSADCRYKDLPVDRVEPSPGSGEAVTEQLNRIESLLRSLVPGSIHSDLGSPEASDARLTHTHALASVNCTTSPPVPTTQSPASVDLLAYDQYSSLYSDYDTALPYHDSITVPGTTGAPIISLSPAPPASISPIPSMASMPALTSMPSISIPSLPSLSLSSASPVSQASMLDVFPPEYFSPTNLLGHNLVTSASTDTPWPHTALEIQRKGKIHHDAHAVIPRETSTAADSFLSMPEVAFFLAPQRGPDVRLSQTHFYDIEARRPLQKELHLYYTPALRDAAWPLPITDVAHAATIDRYVAAYFDHIHPGTPLVSHAQYTALSRDIFIDADADADAAMDTDTDHAIEKAICLTIWALGALVAGHEHDALRYFQPALKIIQHHALWAFAPPSLAVCQALLLAASYFAHIGRPLHNARLVDLAGCQLVRLARRARSFDAERRHEFLVAFWVCFLWESDRAAEFDNPLNIAALSDTMSMPTQRASDDATTMIFLSAEIAARKIANETRKSLYGAPSSPLAAPPPSDADTVTTHKRRRADDDEFARAPPRPEPSKPYTFTAATVSKTLTDSTELSRQLDDWYKLIPDDVRPPMRGSVSDDAKSRRFPSQPTPLSTRAQILRAQYYAIRHIIHRPFVLAVASQQKQALQRESEARERTANSHSLAATNGDDAKHTSKSAAALPPAVLEKCAVCVDACLMFLAHVLPLLDHRSPYLWTFCQNSVACLVVLLVVQACPPMGAHSAARQAFPDGKVRRVNIARLRDQVASKLSRWATEGSSFEAELHLIQSLPMPASDADIFMIPASLAGAARHLAPECIKNE